MRAGAIIVAGGSGSRMGRPKQFLPLEGSTVVEWALRCFVEMDELESVVLVLGEESFKAHGARLSVGKVKAVLAGPTRMGSVRNGFAALPAGVEVVAVHDGARSMITPEIVRATLAEAFKSGAAVAAVPVKDTLKIVERSETRIVSETPDRARFWAAQTPQTYRYSVLREALEKFAGDADATDESQLVERCGHKVSVVESSYENFKITTPEDITMASAIIAARQGARQSRTGFGYDIHRLVEGRELWLAGVKVPHTKGLLGHSDGDAVLHACCDAVLGALGLGEIGIAFPPTDPKFKGLESKAIVAHVLQKTAAFGGEIIHLDATLIAEEPKLKPHYEKLKASLAALFQLPESRVSLKAKSNEGLDAIGRGEAIACHAVATVLTR